jgi:pantoate--beta-alanine ligase
MITLTRVDELRAWCEDARRAGRRVGLVPTMGFFHQGHRSLMRAARVANDAVVVTIFVNPLQFGPSEDLDAYPRDAQGDRALAEAESVDVLFTPSVEEMYPRPALTTVHVADLTDGLCGASRPTHFDGVATVVTKLFSIVGPSRAYFGRKDAQQLAVIHRMVDDLNLPVEVVGCPLVREPDGVAMSSRNAYLSGDQRVAAAVLVRALRQATAAVSAGERDAEVVRRLVTAEVDAEPLATLDYAEVVDGRDLTPVERFEDGTEVLVALAARIGKTRLIDNATITVDGTRVCVDLGVEETQCGAR